MKNTLLGYIVVAIISIGLTLIYSNTQNDGYPYDIFDKDIYNLLEIVSEGSSSGVGITEIVKSDNGRNLLYNLWGNVDSYEITKITHVRMNSFYHITFNDDTKLVIRYAPNLGRTEILVTSDWYWIGKYKLYILIDY